MCIILSAIDILEASDYLKRGGKNETGENIRRRSDGRFEARYAKEEKKMVQSNMVTVMEPQLMKLEKKDLSNFRK